MRTRYQDHATVSLTHRWNAGFHCCGTQSLELNCIYLQKSKFAYCQVAKTRFWRWFHVVASCFLQRTIKKRLAGGKPGQSSPLTHTQTTPRITKHEGSAIRLVLASNDCSLLANTDGCSDDVSISTASRVPTSAMQRLCCRRITKNSKVGGLCWTFHRSNAQSDC